MIRNGICIVMIAVYSMWIITALTTVEQHLHHHSVWLIAPLVLCDPIQQCSYPFLNGIDLFFRSLYQENPADLIHVHLRSRCSLHADDGCSPPANHDTHVVAQFDLCRLQLLFLLVDGILQSRGAAQSVASPKFGLTVVRSACEHVSGRMPLQVPYCHIVRIRHSGRRFFAALGAQVPEEKGSIHGTGRQYALVQRMPRHACYFLVVPLETDEFLHGTNVVELDELITTRRYQPVAVVVPSHLGDGVLVAVQRRETGSRPRVPEFHEVVLAAAGNNARPGMPLGRLDVPPVPLQDAFLRVRRPVPHPNLGIVSTRHELGVARRKTQGVNGLAVVRIDRLHRCNGGRPVLDVSTRVAGEQIVPVVRPGHAPKADVVGGHDEFEAKGNSVPQGEFSLLVARQQTAASRRPAEAHDGSGVLRACHVSQKRQVGGGRIARGDGRDGHAYQSQVRRVGLQVVGMVVSDVRRTARLVIEAIADVNDGGSMEIDASSNQISFGSLLLGILGIVAAVVASAATSAMVRTAASAIVI
mmetsp:Transcript_26851/g.73847  ORF Transcript_26851/g.73847 Transcript_26851/m.73847 type:complete len:528 (-) Transcript_26851:40-1623(-)